MCTIYLLCIILLVNNIRVRNFRHFGWNGKFFNNKNFANYSCYMYIKYTLTCSRSEGFSFFFLRISSACISVFLALEASSRAFLPALAVSSSSRFSVWVSTFAPCLIRSNSAWSSTTERPDGSGVPGTLGKLAN